jgi:hypothetical protein
MAQAPSAQVAPALANAQVVAQAPQCAIVVRSSSQPFTAFPSQSAYPPVQTGWQALDAQLVVP